ncbi:hypothetical protein [Odoribacter sp. AF15-53]|uniref:hypothetical protein n=1 Tax=Odoribacter sp. AF15-53 TaxID=2292236 RepID=UPI000E467148|nr:hypothetical protein [Odoribacter sp. AF15-53]RHR76830.1 hypothetical protein DWW52_15815 [Odoribacter sp. AF15-53]
MTLIANPIYDVVFKFLMEDERVAKMLLSALLKKEIVTLQMRQHEYTSVMQNRISSFRMDFSAKIKEPDGDEHMVLIELQKTWLATETLRFRQYLGTQYLSKTSMCEDDPRFGLPIISIYILGHLLGDLQEPVIYVRRRYLDYDDRVIEQKDPFIESLTHDSIIVQIPCLKGRTRTRLERLLNVFDQDYQMDENAHLLEINEDIFVGEEQLIVTRLLKAGVAPDVRRAMEVEDEILSEIEARDTLIMQKEQEIERKSQEIEQKARELRQREEQVKNITRMLKASGMSEEKILEMLASPIG